MGRTSIQSPYTLLSDSLLQGPKLYITQVEKYINVMNKPVHTYHQLPAKQDRVQAQFLGLGSNIPTRSTEKPFKT